MKIFDASTLIAIFNDIRCPELIDKILQLNHTLAVPSYVMRKELLDYVTLEHVKKLINAKKIRVLNVNTRDEILAFQKRHMGIGLGECDVLLAYQKTKGSETAYCIVDDRQAKNTALKLNAKVTGLLGLLRLLKERSIMTHGEVDDVVTMLKNSNFRLPKDVVI